MDELELLPYQREDVDWLHSLQGRALLGLEQGLGKTVIMATYIKEAQALPALIVAPASAKGNWANELNKWAGVDATIISGETAPDIDPETIKVAIVNYDILVAQYLFLTKIPYKIAVFDESQTLANRQANWTKAAMSLGRRAIKCTCMSGTPISNRPSDFYSTLHLIHPKLYPSFHPYAWKYCNPVRKPWGGGFDFSGASNLEELHAEIKPFTKRRTKAKELNLPPRTIEMVGMEMENLDEYREAEADFIKYLNNRGMVARAGKAQKALAITKMNGLLMLAARGKAKGVVKWARNYLLENPDKKMVIFAVNKLMIDVLYRRILPGQAVAIDGSVPSGKRTAIVKQFQEDANTRLFVGNIVAAGTAITLTAASCTAFAQLPWKPSSVLQAQDRAYRIGQDKAVEQFFLVVPGSIEEKLCTAIQTKQGISDSILEGKPTKSMDLLTLLKETLQ